MALSMRCIFASDFARYEAAFIQDFDACAAPVRGENKSYINSAILWDAGVKNRSSVMALNTQGAIFRHLNTSTFDKSA